MLPSILGGFLHSCLTTLGLLVVVATGSWRRCTCRLTLTPPSLLHLPGLEQGPGQLPLLPVLLGGVAQRRLQHPCELFVEQRVLAHHVVLHVIAHLVAENRVMVLQAHLLHEHGEVGGRRGVRRAGGPAVRGRWRGAEGGAHLRHLTTTITTTATATTWGWVASWWSLRPRRHRSGVTNCSRNKSRRSWPRASDPTRASTAKGVRVAHKYMHLISCSCEIAWGG